MKTTEKITDITNPELEKFIYFTLKPGTNELKSTTFWVRGIGKLRTKKVIREGMLLRQDMFKKNEVTGEIFRVNYETFKWEKQ